MNATAQRPEPETANETHKRPSPYLIRELANWHLERFEEERLSTGKVQRNALDAELRAVLADRGVFPEFIEIEFERVMATVYGT